MLASVVALLALLAVWTVSSGAGKSSTNGKGGDGSGPRDTITAGPSPSGSAISQAPGGRTESGSGAGSGSGGGAGGSGKNGEPGGGNAAGGGAGSAGAGGSAGSGGAGGGGAQVPADSPLPTCPAGSLRWEVKSVKNEYETNEKPRLELVVRNTSGSTCKVGLGPKQAVLTIIQSNGAKAVWSSGDCPAGAADAFFRVSAQGETKQSLEWDRKFSAADQCQTPPAGTATPGTYMVEVKAPGMSVAQASFVLKQD
ncbi:hypothetical protein [Streptomyces sp. NPDC057939]|uniref:hypothetical protein n=1 Tax=Streptomyces sp. NPDC057939 TaxID=3346284 RepID=UPI0036EB221F